MVLVNFTQKDNWLLFVKDYFFPFSENIKCRMSYIIGKVGFESFNGAAAHFVCLFDRFC